MDLSLIGSTLNNYYFLELIGKGGFSDVYKVKSLKYDVIFVAKILFSKNNFCLNQFYCELNSLIKLDHPNIIKIYDSFHYSNKLILILEYCSGNNLYDEICQNGVLNPNSFLNFSLIFSNIILHTHNIGITHRDIKPQNIILDKFNKPKLLDFGLSNFSNNNINNNNLQGTLAFMSPEIINNNCKDFFKSDIWSLGVTYYFILVGHLPFNFDSIKNYKKNLSNLLINFPKNIPKNLKYLINSMICINPLNRYNINQVIDYLKNIELENYNDSNSKYIYSLNIKPFRINSYPFLFIQYSNKKKIRKSILSTNETFVNKN